MESIQQTAVAPGRSSRRGPEIGPQRHRVVVIGGGAAGITVAARLLHASNRLDVTVIEPSSDHYYQPLWTLVGAGVFPKERSRRSESSVMPRDTTWIRDRVVHVNPDRNLVTAASGPPIEYDFLVVAPGLAVDWDGVKGLRGSLGRGGVCSIYGYDQAEVAANALQSFTGGTALFTSPATPIKCGGAPQKIMWLAEDLWRRRGIRDDADIAFVTAGTVIFGMPDFRETLERLLVERNIRTLFQHHLIEIRPDTKEAVFEATEATDKNGDVRVMHYDLLHVTPPMKAPDFVADSPLAHPAGESKGWMNVDVHTLQHPKYQNVFGLGDVAALPTAKTGAAVRKQAPVVVENLLKVAEGTTPAALPARYDGYSSCPIITRYGRVLLAEFGYENVPMPTFPFDQAKERRSMYLLKKYGLPFLYWHLMLRGRA